jgi:hypothetical protein
MVRVADVLIGTDDGLYRVREAERPDRVLDGEGIRALSPDGSGWLAVSETALWRSDDGTSWSEAAAVAGGATCVSAGPSGVFVGLAEARLATPGRGGVAPVASFDRVPGRSTWHTPWGGPPDVRSIAQDPGGVYANVHVGGIPVSRDGGGTWTPTVDIETDVHQVIAGPAPGRVLAACARGLLASGDGGRSWSMRAEGLHATYARAVAVTEDTVFVSASTGPRGRSAAVYRQPLDGSKPFERCTAGLPEWFDANVDTFCLAASGSRVALGTDGGECYRSDDGGSTWERVTEGLPRIACLALASST